jgi:hypothetical protein
LTGASRRGPAWAASLVALALLVGCGDSGESGDDAAGDVKGVGPVTAGSTAQFASCRDWKQGSEENRYATIEDIRGQLTPQSSETAESDLSDEDAYEMFQHTCEAEWAGSLRLYKLYARAQAFAPLTPDE